MNSDWTERDRQQLEQQGISIQQAERQLAILRRAARYVYLNRPCTVGDGIERMDPGLFEALSALHDHAAQQGRWLKFVPASGAATRMFALSDEDQRRQLCERLADFAFGDDLIQFGQRRGQDVRAMIQNGEYQDVVQLLLDDNALGLANRPKGLIPFHRYDEGCRTPFEEHLIEAIRGFAASDGRCRVHMTVSAEHRSLFLDLLDSLRPKLDQRFGSRLEVTFSLQKPSTDTLALDEQDQPLREDDGRLVLRPGGHGALLDNLNDLHGDLVFVKNIDNVSHERFCEATQRWLRIVGGLLVQVQLEVFQQLDDLAAGSTRAVLESAGRLLRTRFPGTSAACSQGGDSVSDLLAALHRPLRICGMVRNLGEPGGGPFWVDQADGGGSSPQIVESAETDPQNPQQQQIARRATHFNPVFMALGLRDHRGQSHDLQEFVDQERFIVTRKSVPQGSVRVLERPGLWNGAMAQWNTILVEVPKEVFNPVKTVFDLLRPEHQWDRS